MNGAAPLRALGTPVPSALIQDNLTHVELTFIEGRIEQWIRFGHAVHEQSLDRRRRLVAFRPESIFAFIRWASNDFGTIVSRIDILRAVTQDEAYQTVPFVRPGAEILLRADSWPRVERVLRAIDEIEGLGLDAATIAPDHWRHIHNRLAGGQEPRSYTLGRHDAWLKRREVE